MLNTRCTLKVSKPILQYNHINYFNDIKTVEPPDGGKIGSVIKENLERGLRPVVDSD